MIASLRLLEFPALEPALRNSRPISSSGIRAIETAFLEKPVKWGIDVFGNLLDPAMLYLRDT
jgi:hypothetical protein